MNKITPIIFIAFISLFLVASAVKEPDDISVSERRKLASFPEITFDSLSDGAAMDNFDKYISDQFPLREDFRKLNAVFQYDVLMQKDIDGIYFADGHISKLEYPLNTDSVNNMTEKINHIYQTYLENSDCNVYYTIIPDKNYYLAEKNGYPSIDYDALAGIMADNINIEYIPIFDKLTADDYYLTDSHWRQESISKVYQTIAKAMNVEPSGKYTVNVYGEFSGVFASQSAASSQTDTLKYITNDVTDSCTVYNFETDSYGGIYDFEKAKQDFDKYSLFLSGPAALLTIESPNADTDKELIIFRDSYGSSLAPYFTQNYKKITLIDIRYVVSDYIGYLIDIDSQDVLFAYSTGIINNSYSLK